MFRYRSRDGMRWPSARLVLLVLLLCFACSKEQKLEKLWEGPAKLNYAKALPDARPASKTNFEKIRFGSGDARLVPPVDWKQGSKRGTAWENALHRWEWIWPLLVAYDTKQDKESLKQATLLALDWVKADLASQNGTQPNRMWSSGNASWRAAALGYVLHAATDANLVSPEQQHQLITSVRKHAAFLANDENYKVGRDSSLYLDFGLAALCANLDKLKDCQVWRDIAKQRFVETANKIFGDAGLEEGQSPMLHTRAAEVVQKMVKVVDAPSLKKLSEKVESATGWLIPPDGRYLLLGESSAYPVPDWARAAATKTKGIKLLGKSGFAVVHDGGSYLLASASFHDKRRKHADDLSFVWSEKGQRIIADSGRGPEKDRASRYFTRSAEAHNVLTVNGQNFAIDGRPYKSALRAIGQTDGWYAITGTNPVLRAGAKHDRTWLYQPGKLLLVIDDVSSDKTNQYDRYFHFWFSLKVKLDDTGQATTAVKKVPLRVFDASGIKDVTAKVVRDQKQPLQGVMFLNTRKPVPNDVLQLTSKGESGVLVTAFVLGKSELGPKDIEVTLEHDVHYVRVGDQKFAISRAGDAINFEMGVAKGESKVAKENEAKEKARAEEEKKEAKEKEKQAKEAAAKGAKDATKTGGSAAKPAPGAPAPAKPSTPATPAPAKPAPAKAPAP